MQMQKLIKKVVTIWAKLPKTTKIGIILGVAAVSIIGIIWRQYILYVLGGAAALGAGASQLKAPTVTAPEPIKVDKIKPPDTSSSKKIGEIMANNAAKREEIRKSLGGDSK